MKLYKNMYRNYSFFFLDVRDSYSFSPKGELLDSDTFDDIKERETGFWRTWYSKEVDIDVDELEVENIVDLFDKGELEELKFMIDEHPDIIGKFDTEDIIGLFEKCNLEKLELIFKVYPFVVDVYKSYTDGLCEKPKNDGTGGGLATGMVIGSMIKK